MDCMTWRMDEDLASVGLLDDKTAELSAHLTDCEDCRRHSEMRERARAALAPDPEECAAPVDLWNRIEAAIDEGIERGEELEPLFTTGGSDAPRLTLSLSCIYCHDALARNEAAYCASCLAPHHGDCFAEHGHCAAPGCDELEIVRPRRESALASTTPRDPRPSWEKQAGPAVGVFLLATVAVAALVDPGLVGREPRKVLIGKGAKGPIGGETVQTAATDGKSAAKGKSKGKLAGNEADRGPVTAEAKDAGPNRDAVEVAGEAPQRPAGKDLPSLLEAAPWSVSEFLQGSLVNIDVVDQDFRAVCESIAELAKANLVVAPRIDERITVQLRQIPWRQALKLICRMCGCEIERGTGGLLLVTQPPRVTIQFSDANVRTVLQLLAAYSGKNIVISDDVKGQVTCDLKNTRWDVALESLLITSDLHARSKGDMIMVSKAELDWGEPFTTERTTISSGHDLRTEPRLEMTISGPRTLAELCAEITDRTGVKIVIDVRVDESTNVGRDATMDFGVKSAAWQDLLVLAARNARLELRDLGSHLRLTRSAGADYRAGGVRASAWLSALCALHEIPVVIGKKAGAVRIEGSYRDLGPSDALELTCREYGLNLERVEGTVRVTASADTKPGVKEDVKEGPSPVTLIDGDKTLPVALEAILVLPEAREPMRLAVISGRIVRVGEALLDDLDEETEFYVSEIAGRSVQIALREQKPGGTEARVVRTLTLRRIRGTK